MDWKHPLYIYLHSPIHSCVQTCRTENKTGSSSCSISLISTHGVSLSQQTTNLLYEIQVQKQSSPFREAPILSTHPHSHVRLSLKTPMIHSFSQDPPPCPLPTVNFTHRVGGRRVRGNTGATVSCGPLNTPHTVKAVERECVRSAKFTHNALPPLCLFGLGKSGCHGWSPKPALDLLQVVLWLLSIRRSFRNPWPRPLGSALCPNQRDRAGVVAEGRGDMGIREDWVVCVWKQILPHFQQMLI